MNIKDVAQRSGLPAKTIRYYEDIGLIRPLRQANGYRSFRESDLRRHLVNEVALDDKKLEADRQQDPRFKMTAEELQAKGIKDFQLYYAIQTLRRTATLAKKR